MLRSVSSVNFRANSSQNVSNSLNLSNKSSYNGKLVDIDYDEAEKKVPASYIAGGVAAALLATWVALGVAVGRKGSRWEKIVPLEGEKLKFSEKVKNFFYEIGKSADDTYKKVFKKAVKTADTEKTNSAA